jgi:hypothetical protein
MWEPYRAAILELERQQFPTLEAWLTGLHRGTVNPDDGAHEHSIYRYVPPSTHRHLGAVLTRRLSHWPLLCRCGAEFLPIRRNNTHCSSCRAAAKEHRKHPI